MAQSEPLPERLQYLQPFRELLAKLPKAEVGDGMDTTLLEELIHEQIRGKTAKEAQEKLNADLEELESYLSVPRRCNDRLHFVVGFLLIAAEKPEELLKPPQKPKEILERLAMELPPKAKSSGDQYSLTVKWKRQNFLALICNMDDGFSREYTLARLAHPNASGYELLDLVGKPDPQFSCPNAPQKQPSAISVNLGKVVGHKRIEFSESPFVWKGADYLLQIPGGYVSVVIQAGHIFDDSEWEPYMATLRFEKPSAVGATSL